MLWIRHINQTIKKTFQKLRGKYHTIWFLIFCSHNLKKKVFTVLLDVMLLILPLLIMTVMYGLIVRHLWKVDQGILLLLHRHLYLYLHILSVYSCFNKNKRHNDKYRLKQRIKTCREWYAQLHLYYCLEDLIVGRDEMGRVPVLILHVCRRMLDVLVYGYSLISLQFLLLRWHNWWNGVDVT